MTGALASLEPDVELATARDVISAESNARVVDIGAELATAHDVISAESNTRVVDSDVELATARDVISAESNARVVDSDVELATARDVISAESNTRVVDSDVATANARLVDIDAELATARDVISAESNARLDIDVEVSTARDAISAESNARVVDIGAELATAHDVISAESNAGLVDIDIDVATANARLVDIDAELATARDVISAESNARLVDSDVELATARDVISAESNARLVDIDIDVATANARLVDIDIDVATANARLVDIDAELATARDVISAESNARLDIDVEVSTARDAISAESNARVVDSDVELATARDLISAQSTGRVDIEVGTLSKRRVLQSALIRLLAIGTLFATAPARAERQPIAVSIADCDNANEIRRILGVELGGELDDTARERASVTCDASRAVLRVDSLMRTVELDAEMPKARPRLIALALAELIATSRSDATMTPAAARAADAPTLVAHDSIDQEPAQLRIYALAGGLGYSSNTGLLAGGGLRIMRDGELLGILADVQAHHGRHAVSLGDVTTDTVDLTAALSIHRTWSRVRGLLAAGARGGAVRLGGSSDQMMVQANHFWAPWLGALGLASVELAATSRIALGITVEGGAVIVPVGGLVNAQREVAIDGGWLALHLGIGFLL